MVTCRYERIPFCTHVNRIRVAFIRIDQMYLKRNALMASNRQKMLLLATKQCMIWLHETMASNKQI